jgi:1,4-dihydroxy-2-naphthoate octaprenyltransferase
MSRLRALVAMTRPSQIALIVVIAVNGMLLGLWQMTSASGRQGSAALGLLLVVVAAASTHLANEAADHHTDQRTRRTPFSGGSGALQASRLSPRLPLQLSLTIAVAVAIVALLGAAAGALSLTALALLLIGLAGGLAYSLSPVAAMRRGWGEPLNALLGAMLLPLYGVAAMVETVGVSDVIAFLPLFCVSLASVMATAWPDRTADAATGKATMQVHLAPTTLRRIHLAASGAFVAATLLSAAVGAMPLALAGLLVTPLVVVGALTYTRRRSAMANVSAMVGLVLITTVALVAEVVGDGAPG